MAKRKKRDVVEEVPAAPAVGPSEPPEAEAKPEPKAEPSPEIPVPVTTAPESESKGEPQPNWGPSDWAAHRARLAGEPCVHPRDLTG